MRVQGMLCFVALMVVFVHAQQEVTIVASKDNTMFESSTGASSNGIGIYTFAGKTNGASIRRGLIMFPLDSIPAGSTITSAKVRLNMSKSQNTTNTVRFHKILSSWGEGASDAEGNQGNEGSGGASTPNDATWIHRFFSTELWSNPGGDYTSTGSAETQVAGVGKYDFGSNELMIADVQSWLNDTSSNHGWIIIGDESAGGTAKRFDTRGNTSAANRPTLIVQYTTPTNVYSREEMPLQFSLEQNYPNPFNPSTVIRYSISTASDVSLKVFDILGKEIAVLVNEKKEAGSFSYEWKTVGLSSGIYFYRLQSGNNVSVKKLILTK